MTVGGKMAAEAAEESINRRRAERDSLSLSLCGRGKELVLMLVLDPEDMQVMHAGRVTTS